MLNAGGIAGQVQYGSDADLNNDSSGGREHPSFDRRSRAFVAKISLQPHSGEVSSANTDDDHSVTAF